jgi:hypothetical protein
MSRVGSDRLTRLNERVARLEGLWWERRVRDAWALQRGERG